MSPGNEYKSMQSSLKSWKQDCVCFAHVCVFVEWKDVAEFCFCHDYTWWNNASGDQMESLCERAT